MIFGSKVFVLVEKNCWLTDAYIHQFNDFEIMTFGIDDDNVRFNSQFVDEVVKRHHGDRFSNDCLLNFWHLFRVAQDYFAMK